MPHSDYDMVPKDVTCLLFSLFLRHLSFKKIHFFLYHHSRNSKIFVMGDILKSNGYEILGSHYKLHRNFFNEWDIILEGSKIIQLL